MCFNVPHNWMPTDITTRHSAALRVALVNEYMLTFFKILSFKVHAADDLESSGISKPNGERDWKKECVG